MVFLQDKYLVFHIQVKIFTILGLKLHANNLHKTTLWLKKRRKKIAKRKFYKNIKFHFIEKAELKQHEIPKDTLKKS